MSGWGHGEHATCHGLALSGGCVGVSTCDYQVIVPGPRGVWLHLAWLGGQTDCPEHPRELPPPTHPLSLFSFGDRWAFVGGDVDLNFWPSDKERTKPLKCVPAQMGGDVFHTTRRTIGGTRPGPPPTHTRGAQSPAHTRRWTWLSVASLLGFVFASAPMWFVLFENHLYPPPYPHPHPHHHTTQPPPSPHPHHAAPHHCRRPLPHHRSCVAFRVACAGGGRPRRPGHGNPRLPWRPPPKDAAPGRGAGGDFVPRRGGPHHALLVVMQPGPGLRPTHGRCLLGLPCLHTHTHH